MKKVITIATSDKDCRLGIVSKLRPEMYRPIAQIKRITSCFKVFVFIIGGNYKLIKLLIFKSTTKFKFGLQKRTYSSI